HAFRISVPAAVVVAAQLLQPCGLGLRQVEPVHRLREAQVRVDAGNDDARVDRDQLDPDHGDPHLRVDDEPLVEDQVDDVGEPTRARRALEVVARGSSSRYGHPNLLSSNSTSRARGGAGPGAVTASGARPRGPTTISPKAWAQPLRRRSSR